MTSENHRRTKCGNLAGPGYEQVIDWVIRCWDELDPSIILNSYAHCGLNPTEYVQADFNHLFHYHHKMNKHMADLIQKNAVQVCYIDTLTQEEIESSAALSIDFNVIEPEDYPDHISTGLVAATI
jgi:hypothetical protein